MSPQLFSLRRVCAAVNSTGGGSANVSGPLLDVLRVVHEKARAAVAADAAQRRAAAATKLAEGSEEVGGSLRMSFGRQKLRQTQALRAYSFPFS